MYFEIPFTDELRKRIERRRDHFESDEWTWARKQKLKLFFLREKVYPKQDKLDLYNRLTGGSGIVTAIPNSVKKVFMTPEEYHELFCVVYSFEISSASIRANSISASKLTVDKLKPTTADFGMDGV